MDEHVSKILSSICPLLLGSALVIVSIVKQNIKGLVYLAGIFLASFFHMLLVYQFAKSSTDSIKKCNFIQSAYEDFPAYNSMFIAFTAAYITCPMVFYKEINYMFIAFLSIIFCCDAGIKLHNTCTSIGGTLFGAILGLLFGCAWFFVFHMSDNVKLLYFEEFNTSNNEVCGLTKKQSFVCNVYRNGKLIKQEKKNIH